MKSQKFNRYGLGIIILFAAISCHDNDLVIVKEACKVKSIATTKGSMTETTTYQYDERRRVIEVNNDGEVRKYQYDAQSRVSKVEIFGETKEEYGYEGAMIKVTRFWWDSSANMWRIEKTATCYLTPNGIIKAIATTLDSVIYSYDTKNNVIKSTTYFDNMLAFTFELKYSGIKNPQAVAPASRNRVLAFDPLAQSPYLPLTISVKGVGGEWSGKVEYVKNKNNLPESSKTVIASDNSFETYSSVFTYSCEKQ